MFVVVVWCARSTHRVSGVMFVVVVWCARSTHRVGGVMFVVFVWCARSTHRVSGVMFVVVVWCARSTHRVSGVICVVFVWCVRSTGVVRSLWSSVWCVRKSADHSTAVCKFNVKLNLNQQKKKNAVSRIHIGCSCITRSFVLKGDETSVFFVKTTLAVEHLAFLLWSD